MISIRRFFYWLKIWKRSLATYDYDKTYFELFFYIAKLASWTHLFGGRMFEKPRLVGV